MSQAHLMNPDYINEFKLLNGMKADEISENCCLISEYWFDVTGVDAFGWDITIYWRKCRTTSPGLYNQFPMGVVKSNMDDYYMSPDQLIALIRRLYILGDFREIRKIANWLEDHYNTYDNLSAVTNLSRMQQPQVLAFARACLGGSTTALSVICIYSYLTKWGETSGRLKSRLMFTTLGMDTTRYICAGLLRLSKFKNKKGLYLAYFWEKAHPIHRFLLSGATA